MSTPQGPYTVRNWTGGSPGAVVLEGSTQILSTTSDAQTEALSAGLLATVKPAITVKATPTGPPAPSGGWKCVMAEGFNASLGTSTSLFAPNRNDNNGDGGVANVYGFNTNEVEVFAASQTSLTSAGCVLTAIPDVGATANPGTGTVPTSVLVKSGCLSSQPVTSGGQQGFPIHGFGFTPTAGTITVLEFVATLPPFTRGLDFGLWSGSPEGQSEIDFNEITDYDANVPLTSDAFAAWYNHATGAAAGGPSYKPAWRDGNQHTFTTAFDGTSHEVATYVDRVMIPGMSYPWLANPFAGVVNYLLISFAFRDAYPNQGPDFTSPVKVTVRSAACYQDASHAGSGIVGGGIAAGTTVV